MYFIGLETDTDIMQIIYKYANSPRKVVIITLFVASQKTALSTD
jgi:hypothetical protein